MRKFVKSCFIMLPLLLVSLFTLSCENILNNNRTSISFSIGEDAVSYIKDSCRTVNSFTEDTEIEVVCSLLKGEKLALQESKKGPMKNVGDFFFRFYDIPFSNDYKVKVGFFYNDIITFYASSDTFGISKGNIHPTINLAVEPVPQKINYNLNGGNITNECPKTYYINSNIRIPSPTKEGFTFSHWELDDGTKITVLGKDNFLGEVTLNAKWKEQVITPDTQLYKVTFVSNGHGTAPQSIELPKGSFIPVEKLAPLNAEGYTFAGWFKDDKTFKQEWNQSVDTVQTSPITLYAKWNINTYKITYETGVTQTVTQKTVTYGSKLEAIHLPSDLVKDKYDFTNWKYKGGSKDGNVAKIGDKITEDITLVATWTLQGQVKNVEFNIATPTVDYGTSIVLTSEKGSTIYYTTDNLDPKTSSTKVTVSPSASGLTTSNPIIIEKETTIKAYATIPGKIDSEVVGNTYKILTHAVNFDAKGHGTSPQSIELHKGSVIPTEKLAPLTAEGYTFGGWFKDNNTFTQEWDPLVDTVQKSDVTLYAKWDINTYNITYKNCDELSLTHNNKKTYTIEDNITLTDPLRTGYRFGGWYISSDGSEPQYIEGNKITNIKGRTGDITLYAKWDVITYTITYKTGTTQTVTAKSINHGSKLEASHLPTDLVRDQFTFENWKYSGGSKDGTVAKIGDIVTENITLTATWTPFGQTADVVITGPDGNNVEKKGTDITLSCSTPGAQIYYTIDGSEPSTSLTPVLSPATITLTDAATVKAFATSDKNVQSATKEEVFVLKKYNVNFVTIYGSVPPVSLTEGTKISEPSNLTQTGYTLSGWIKEKANPSDPDVLWNFSNDTMPGKDITLTAKWDVISYNITYNNCEHCRNK